MIIVWPHARGSRSSPSSAEFDAYSSCMQLFIEDNGRYDCPGWSMRSHSGQCIDACTCATPQGPMSDDALPQDEGEKQRSQPSTHCLREVVQVHGVEVEEVVAAESPQGGHAWGRLAGWTCVGTICVS